MVEWVPDCDFISHATTLTMGGVDASLSPADAGVPLASVELYGQCRDTTTTKATKGEIETRRLR